MKQVKELLFTPTGLMVTVLHVCFLVGLITCTVGFKLYVLGEDPAKISAPVRK
jgi:hypothetical protein